jgi:hypothetical protein
MEFLIALVAALALGSIPLILGWRRTASDAAMAHQMGIAAEKKKFDPEKWALQTGTGLTFNQIAIGFLTWVGAGFIAGLALGLAASVLFAVAGGFLYAGTLADKRQAFRLLQAQDILRGLSVVETLLGQGRSREEALEGASKAVGPAGRMVLGDLVTRLRTEASDGAAIAVRAWTAAWDNPAVDIVATSLLTSIEGRIEIAPLIGTLRSTLSGVIEVLSRARAAAKGVEWQARFLALFPPFVLIAIGIFTPEAGQMYGNNPLLLSPVLLGSGLSYWLSMGMIRNGLSIEASMGLQAGEVGMIKLDRMGRIE